ncbi:hypothetical protein ACIRU8_39170 [Streptomyces sp. NPDC101175]|uniref:hypothetical protein n=1 Tax=Streptomyces sp. NPDC101175 TaxID=3366123 RepID=UPI003839002F
MTDPTPETARYRNRTAVVDAIQWTGSNAEELRAFCGPDFDGIAPEDRTEDPEQTAMVRTHEHGGWLGLKPTDWVLKHGEGRFSSARDQGFRETWEPVPAVVPPADQTALRERIARAIFGAHSPGIDVWDAVDRHGKAVCRVEADAVLAVLPVSGRAATLLWAADRYEVILASQAAEHSTDPRYYQGVHDVILGLRRLAGEAEHDEAWDVPDARPGTTDHTLLRRRAGAQSRETCANCHGSGLDPRCNGEFDCPDCAPARAARQDPTPDGCGCPHPVDEHSVYGCADGCGCEWMPKKPPMDPVHILGIGAERDDPTQCSGEEGFCPEHGYHRHSLKQNPAVSSGQPDTDGEA